MLKLKRLFVFLVVFFWLLVLGILLHTTMAEPIYEVTSTQLNALTSELLLQKENNKTLLMQLNNGSLSLQELLTKLNLFGQQMKDYDQKLADLESQVLLWQENSTTLLTQLERTKNLLVEARQLYNESVKAAQKEIRKLKFQRNAAIIIAIAKWIL